MPVVSSFSQNVGIVSMNKVVSRRVITIACAIMLALGIVPKFSALVSTLPAPVIGGGTLIVFGMITLTGLKLVSSEPLTARNSTIVGVSIALAMGLSTLEGTAALENFPPLAQALLSKPVVVAGVMSFLLNLLAPGKPLTKKPGNALPWTPNNRTQPYLLNTHIHSRPPALRGLMDSHLIQNPCHKEIHHLLNCPWTGVKSRGCRHYDSPVT